MTKLKEFFLKFKWWIAALVLAAFAANVYFSREAEIPYETATVVRGDVIQEVSVTGRVVSDATAELAFERGGKIASVLAQVGDSVARGDVLVRLDTSELAAQRAQAKANLEYENLRLAELQRGAREEELAVYQARIRSAQSAVIEAEKAYADRLWLALDAMQDAIYAKTDGFFENPRTTSPKFLIPVPDQRLVTQLEAERIAVGAMLDFLSGDPDRLIGGVEQGLTETKKYIDDLLLGVSSLQPSASYGQTSIDAAKANILAARTSLTSAQTAVLAAREKSESAYRALEVAQNEYDLKRAPATPEVIAAQEARVASARAALDSIDVQIAKSELRAPFSGIVTRQDAKRGETVGANVRVVSLQSAGEFKIEANVPEVDVAKISLGDEARVSLDAYGSSEIFPSVVESIDPAETIIGGVPTYKVTLRLREKDDRVKSGMTANIDIRTDMRTGVLNIPARAVLTSPGGEKFVRVPDGMATRDVPVTVGLRGSNGTIEILSGLSEGDTIVTFIKGQ